MVEKNLPPEPTDKPVFNESWRARVRETGKHKDDETFKKVPVPDLREHHASTSDRVWQGTRHFFIGAAMGVGGVTAVLVKSAPQLLIKPITWVFIGVTCGVLGGFEARRKIKADRRREQGIPENEVSPKWLQIIISIAVKIIMQVIEARAAKKRGV